MNLLDVLFLAVLLLVIILTLILDRLKRIFHRPAVKRWIEICASVLLFTALFYLCLTDDLMATFRFVAFLATTVYFVVKEILRNVK